jgi:hypothetical protein
MSNARELFSSQWMIYDWGWGPVNRGRSARSPVTRSRTGTGIITCWRSRGSIPTSSVLLSGRPGCLTLRVASPTDPRTDVRRHAPCAERAGQVRRRHPGPSPAGSACRRSRCGRHVPGPMRVVFRGNWPFRIADLRVVPAENPRSRAPARPLSAPAASHPVALRGTSTQAFTVALRRRLGTSRRGHRYRSAWGSSGVWMCGLGVVRRVAALRVASFPGAHSRVSCSRTLAVAWRSVPPAGGGRVRGVPRDCPWSCTNFRFASWRSVLRNVRTAGCRRRPPVKVEGSSSRTSVRSGTRQYDDRRKVQGRSPASRVKGH